MTLARLSLFALLLGLCATLTVAAHPHMFAETQLTFQVSQRRLEGLWVEWTFDPLFTAAIMFDYDSNQDGRFDESETRAVKAGAFDELSGLGYFVYVRTAGTEHPVTEVRAFTASQSRGRLRYSFFIPLNLPVTLETGPVRVVVYDPTYYCDFRFPDDLPVKVTGEGAGGYAADLQEQRDTPILYNPFDTAGADNLGARLPGRYTGVAYPMAAVLRAR